MNKFSDKVKYTIYAMPETIENAKKMYREDGCPSVSEFIEKAINFYYGYLMSNNIRNYFPSVIISSVNASLDSFEDRMAALLFKMAVELCMLQHLLAEMDERGFDETYLRQLRGYCVEEVKRTLGRVSFEDAARAKMGS